MKFRSERDSLADVLASAARAAGGRAAGVATLSGLLLRLRGNQLVVTGTDLDLTIRIEHEVIGIEDGACVVPARLSADVVRAMEPGAVTVESDEQKGDTIEISSARAHFGLRAFPVVDFPTLDDPPPAALELPRGLFIEALRQVVRAASGDDARALLTGVFVTTDGGALRLVATDSYRLAMRDLAGVGALTGVTDVLVPARALAELHRIAPSQEPAPAPAPAKAGDAGSHTPGGAPAAAPAPPTVAVSTGASKITFSLGPVRISTRLLGGTYPDYKQLIPAHYPNRLHVGRESLLSALRRVKLLVRDNTTPVHLSLRANGVDLSVVSSEIGDATETVDGDFTGEDLVIAFNPGYLIEGVDAVLDDEVFLEVDTPARAAMVRAASKDDFRYLLMPVHTS